MPSFGVLPETVVPLYTFAINDGPDEPGTVLDDLRAARHEARRLLAMCVSEFDILSGECKSWSCVIREEGSDVLRVVLATLVENLSEQSGDRLIFRPK